MRVIYHVERIRKACRMTQQELEARSGVSQGTICLIERGESDPRVSTVAKLAKGLGVSVHALFDVDNGEGTK